MLDPNTRNKDTKAIITGGAQGIGFAIARQLAAEGCKSIVLAGRTPEKGAKAVDQLKALGADALFVQADVSKVEDCRRIVASALDRFGTINGLVNAAATSARGSLTETTPELFDQIFNTNVRGPFFLMQGVVKRLLETNTPGSILNILSMSAHAGQSFLNPYSSSKGALATMTKHGVRRLPVIDGHDLVGIVTQADVARNLPDDRIGDLVEAISSAPSNN